MRKSVVILEGPDGSGKTTLAEALVSAGFEYDHCGAPEKSAVDFYKDALRRHTKSVVLDRWHAGSYVYGTVFRGHDDLTDDERWTLEGTALVQGGVMVYACPDAQVIERNLQRGPDDSEAVIYEAPEKRAEVRERYEEFMSAMTQLPTLSYDFGRPRALESMVHTLTTRRQLFDEGAMLPEDLPALGNIVNPRYVFVGDEPGGRAKVLRSAKRFAPTDAARRERFTQLAFKMADYYDQVPFQDCSSGRYFHLALMAANLSLQDYCVFNSRQLTGEDVHEFLSWDQDFWWRPGWQSADVVALGNAASARLDAANIRHRTIPHPSYWKRFKYRDVYTYTKLLKGEQAWER